MQTEHPLLKAVSAKAKALSGAIRVPGDKSISHRALMLGGMAVGETRISGLLTGEDVLRTAAAMRALGAIVEDQGAIWSVRGRGVGGLREPENVLDMGNSGTAARLIAGLLSVYPFTTFLTGDASLRGRPMDRVIAPLSQTGARFVSRAGGRLPMAITGTDLAGPLSYVSPIASAQVKSAVLLAGLHAPGVTTFTEPAPSRDHTERMLRYFGAQVASSRAENGSHTVRLTGRPELVARPVVVPGDPSSAAFPLVAAILVPGSSITILNVGMNPLRTGLFTTLREMGADIEVVDPRDEAGEPVADLRVKYSRLQGVTVPAARVPAMIDEYPILAVAAAFAEGETRMEGLAELKIKESDRLTAMAEGLQSCGITARIEGDTLIVRGGRARAGIGAPIAVNLDHRIAMSFLVLGMATECAVMVDDASAIATSFPGFIGLMNELGADMQKTQ